MKQSSEQIFHGILTQAPQMQRLFEQIEAAAHSEAPVLVRGETGTGKELVARAIHAISKRRPGPYRAVNCATFSPELLASELFGHIKGAFTGAVADRPGLFKQTDGGTVFLDEIAEIPLPLQAQLLRVLEHQAFVPLGGSKVESTDVRVVSATHRALRRLVAEGQFRSDLMYRVRVLPLFIPPLRDRTGDIDLLSSHFLELLNARGPRRVSQMEPSAKTAMQTYPWPGNVRELRNVLEYAVAMGRGPVIRLQDLTPELRGEDPPEPPGIQLGTQSSTEAFQLIRTLQQVGGKKGLAAKQLGMSRTTLWRKLREHGLS